MKKLLYSITILGIITLSNLYSQTTGYMGRRFLIGPIIRFGTEHLTSKDTNNLFERVPTLFSPGLQFNFVTGNFASIGLNFAYRNFINTEKRYFGGTQKDAVFHNKVYSFELHYKRFLSLGKRLAPMGWYADLYLGPRLFRFRLNAPEEEVEDFEKVNGISVFLGAGLGNNFLISESFLADIGLSVSTASNYLNFTRTQINNYHWGAIINKNQFLQLQISICYLYGGKKWR